MHESAEVTELRELLKEVKIWREDSERGQKDGRAKLSEVIRKIDEKIASLCKVQTGVLDHITELDLVHAKIGLKVLLLLQTV